MEPSETGISVAPPGLAGQTHLSTTGWRPWLMTYAPAGAAINVFDLMHAKHVPTLAWA